MIMKSLSCISLSRMQDPPSPTHGHHNSVDSCKDNSKAVVLGHKGPPRIQTIIEVLRCEFARPPRSASKVEDSELPPSKHWSPLHYAAFYNREAALTHFLRAGQSPDGTEDFADTPLLVAVAAGHVGIVKTLCAADANVKATTAKDGETALHLSIRYGRTDMMDTILAYGPELGASTLSTKETPLHYAATRPGSLAAVVTLLKAGANYEALDSKGRTPAEVAITNSNIHAAVAIVGAARGKRRKLAKEKEMLLRHVEKAQNRFSMKNELIADIFEAGCDPDSTVLVEAIKRNDVALAEMFLEKGADPNRPTATGLRPVFVALDCCSAKIIQLLVKHKVDVAVRDSEGMTVLQAALESPSAHDKEAIQAILEALLSGGADAKISYPDGKTLLHHAARLRLPRIAQRLLEHGVKVNHQDNQGNAALHLASQSKSCIDLLLKQGADANFTNYNGLTPLLFAVSTVASETEPDLEPLVKASSLRLTNKKQKTALHISAEKGLEKTVRFLLRLGAETTLLDYKKRTPLLLAVLHHQWAVIPLMATQPGINSWDESGMTALHHIVTSIPKPPASWKDIAFATAKFCERGVSRSMRDRSGATPLIAATKALPEEGVAVIEALLAEKGPSRSNCVGHEDHKQRSALFFAATQSKPEFVQVLLKYGAPFTLKDWTAARGPIQPDTPAHKQTLKLLAEHDWIRRMRTLQRTSAPGPTISTLPKILSLRDIRDLLSMGLDLNALPVFSKSSDSKSLLWAVLKQTLVQPPLPPQYLQDVLKLLLEHGADANILAMHNSTPRTSGSQKLTCHPVTFLLEQYPTIDIDLITLLLDSGANLTTVSSAYEGRYPLHSAVKANRLDVVDEFLTRKADANTFDMKQHTPLVIATELGLWEIVDLLIQHKAKLDCKDAEGNTLLHVAASRGSSRIVSSLLRAGAKASTKNGEDVVPRSCVPETLEEKESEKIVKMLRYAEAQEAKDFERRQKKLEQEAMLEGKERMRREREQAQQAKISRNPSPEKGILAATSPSLPYSSSTVSLANTSAKLKPQPSPSLQQPTKPTASLKPAPNTQKPLPQPRIDSGFGHAHTATEKPLPALDRTKATFDGKPVATEQKPEQNDELAGWLAMSKMIDNL